LSGYIAFTLTIVSCLAAGFMDVFITIFSKYFIDDEIFKVESVPKAGFVLVVN